MILGLVPPIPRLQMIRGAYASDLQNNPLGSVAPKGDGTVHFSALGELVDRPSKLGPDNKHCNRPFDIGRRRAKSL
jgi:hypothetical protein